MTESRNQAVAAPGAALPAARFRHERKHYITPADHAALCQRLAPVMERDPHAGPDGTYTVHSLYFDDWRDTALREKIDGLPRREKFRIRYYNGDLSFIRLEKKSKVRSLCRKEGAPLSLEQCRQLMRGEFWRLPQQAHPLVAEFAAKCRWRQLRPRTCVVYRRDAFLYGPGNVRITVDDRIGSGSPAGFLEPDQPLCTGSTVLLEVKYDQFLPEHIAGLVELSHRWGTAFSKYACARQAL